MKKEILLNDMEFWVSQNIIYCKVLNSFNEIDSHANLEEVFYEAISILSDGSYLPIIFDFKEVNGLLLVKLFKIISSNNRIKNSVLSKAFLVKNYRQKILLSFYVMFSDSNVPNLVFNEMDAAVEHSSQNYSIFNSVSDDSIYGKQN